MDSRYELLLFDGQASLRDLQSDKPLKLGKEEHTAYEHAQQATELAVQAICAGTGRMKGDDPDDVKIGEAFTNGDVSLLIRGHARECRVVALHLHARYGLDFDAMTIAGGGTPAVRIEPVDDAPDGYSTYRFESDMRPLNAMRDFLERWLHEAQREPRAKEKSERSAERWRSLLTLGADSSGAPVCVVITGVTGAGKSTFLNAILGREVVPHSSGVCTATILRLRRAENVAEEGFTVVWRLDAEIKQLVNLHETELKHVESRVTKIKTALTGESFHALEERAIVLKKKIPALQSARHLARDRRRTLPLKEIGNYARNAPESWAEAVDGLDIALAHPLLGHVSIIDAPGLRDGDAQRQRQVLRAFEGDTAWLYLAPAAERSDTCKDDWRHIQSLSHNSAGVLVLTKADGQPSDPGKTTRETMQARLRDYRAYGWNSTTEWCSALLPAQLGVLGPGADETALVRACDDAKLPGLLSLSGRKVGRRLVDFMLDRRSNAVSWQTFVDYSLDASRLPVAVRKVGRKLFDDAIARRIVKGRGELEAAVREAIDYVVEGIANAQRVLKEHDAIETQKTQLEEQRVLLLSITEELATTRKKNASTLRVIVKRGKGHREAFRAAVAARQHSLKSAFEASFIKQNSGIWMRGSRSFALVAQFQAPLSEEGHQLLLQHLSVVLEDIRGPENRKDTLSADGLLNSYGMMEVDDIGDVEDEEGFWELKGTTEVRMWATLDRKAQRCAKGLEKGFKAKLMEIYAFAKVKFDDEKKHCLEHIAAVKTEAASLEKAIKENNPAQSRVRAKETLRSLTDHKKAFADYLADLVNA
jgi:Dynamin family